MPGGVSVRDVDVSSFPWDRAFWRRGNKAVVGEEVVMLENL